MKLLFRKAINSLEKLPSKIIVMKTWFFEWLSIISKFKLYQNIKWTKEQKKEFNSYWQSNFGKKISPRWHKLFESINGHFDVAYLPDIIYSTKIEPKRNQQKFASVFENKALIEIFAKFADVKIPATIILNCDDVFYDAARLPCTKEKALLSLSEHKILVVKPISGGSSGKGVKVLKNESINLAWLDNTYKKNYIIQEIIDQNSLFKQIHPESVNTIRIITYLKKDCVTHLPLTMRIGTGNSCVDNIHAGGLVIGVSDEGVLKDTAYCLGYCDNKKTYKKHPDTDVVFENYKLPLIPEVINSAHKLHGLFPYIHIISWDFTVDNNDDVILIEANMSAQGFWFPQIVNKFGAAKMFFEN